LSLSNQATDSAAVAQNVKLVAMLDSNIDTSTGKVSCIVATAPAPLTLSDFTCTPSGHTFTIALLSGKVFPAKGATATVMIKVTTPTTVASISTSGTLTYQGSTGTPPTVSDNDVIVSTPTINITESDDALVSGKVTAGNTVHFTININETNPAPSAVATAVKVTATIDPLMTYNAGSCTLSGTAMMGATCVPDSTDPTHRLIITLTNSVTQADSARIVFSAMSPGTPGKSMTNNKASITFNDGAGANVAQTPPPVATNRTLTTN